MSALEEFGKVGLAAAQVDRIVEKAGVSRGTFYFHFPTKEHVLLEAQTRAEADLVERLRAHGPPPDSVRRTLHLLFDKLMEVHEVDHAVRREVLAMYIRQPIRLELAAQPLIVEVVDYFADAAERGAVRDDVAPEQMAVHFLQMIPFLMLGEEERNEDLERPIDVSIELFLGGVEPRGPSR